MSMRLEKAEGGVTLPGFFHHVLFRCVFGNSAVCAGMCPYLTVFTALLFFLAFLPDSEL